MRNTKTAFAALALVAALAAAPALAHNHEQQDVVYDQRGEPVTSAVTGDCVYSTYQTTTDPHPCKAKAPVMDIADRTFFFGFDSAKLTPEAKTKLDKVAATIVAAGNVHTAKITGFADRVGAASYNLKLSKRRAEAVQKYLVKKGVSNTAITEVQAVGESAPVTNCKGDKVTAKLVACLKPDRRVELNIE